MSHEWNCRCGRCAREWEREMTILGVLPEPDSTDEARERLVQEHNSVVVWPAIRDAA